MNKVFDLNPTTLALNHFNSCVLCAARLIKTPHQHQRSGPWTAPSTPASLPISSRKTICRLWGLALNKYGSLTPCGAYSAAYTQPHHVTSFPAVSHLCLWVDRSKVTLFCLFITLRMTLRSRDSSLQFNLPGMNFLRVKACTCIIAFYIQ